MGIKLLSHLIKLLHLMTLSSQQFYLCYIIFNVHNTLIKHTLRLCLTSSILQATARLHLRLSNRLSPIHSSHPRALKLAVPQMRRRWHCCAVVSTCKLGDVRVHRHRVGDTFLFWSFTRTSRWEYPNWHSRFWSSSLLLFLEKAEESQRCEHDIDRVDQSVYKILVYSPWSQLIAGRV